MTTLVLALQLCLTLSLSLGVAAPSHGWVKDKEVRGRVGVVGSELVRRFGDEAKRSLVLAAQALAGVPPRLGRLRNNRGRLRTNRAVRRCQGVVEGLRYQ